MRLLLQTAALFERAGGILVAGLKAQGPCGRRCAFTVAMLQTAALFERAGGALVAGL